MTTPTERGEVEELAALLRKRDYSRTPSIDLAEYLIRNWEYRKPTVPSLETIRKIMVDSTNQNWKEDYDLASLAIHRLIKEGYEKIN